MNIALYTTLCIIIHMILPNIATTRQIQTNYRSTFDLAKKSGPVVVMTNNKPDVVIIGYDQAKKLFEKSRIFEMQETMEAIQAYQQAKKTKKFVKASSLADLI